MARLLSANPVADMLATPPTGGSEAMAPDNRFALAALERHKREGMELAVRARTIAMLVIAVMVSVLTPWPEAIYYLVLIALFIGIGLLQRRVGRVGVSNVELVLLFCDLLLMTIIAAVQNPFAATEFPATAQYQFDIHKYFFVILATATLTYSWRTIFAVGTWAGVMWAIAALGVWYFYTPDAALSAAVRDLYAGQFVLQDFFDPTVMIWDQRIQEIVVFLMCAFILGISVRRFNMLLLEQASVERERANLARYFSPNVVDQLSHNDDPLREVRTQDVAVLFVDIVGFTAYAADRPAEETIATLRDFHGRMEAEVFRHDGTLDKYLGDGLMATFGTPFAGERDAMNALACARAMMQAVEAWNAERRRAGEEPIQASFGLHFGPVVLGDIGANRLEFAVIGNTVNVASRLEALSRPLGVSLVASDDLVAEIRRANPGGAEAVCLDLARQDPQDVRGLSQPMTVWALPGTDRR